MRTSPIGPAPGGVILAVFCQPGAVRTAVIGLHGSALKVKVKAPPEGGQANEALMRLLAETFGVPRSAVSLLSGAQSRNKRIAIKGLAPEAATTLLEAALQP